jgi:outer membrane receptor protein involved in Fe transport
VYRFAVRDRLAAGTEAGAPRPDGVRWAGIVSPRASLAVDAARGTTLFANFGGGFHSNDARDAVLAGPGERILPRALGWEAGARHSWSGGSVAAAAWTLGLQSELVYVGDEGTTEPSGRTRRRGVDAEARVRLLSWLWADADLSLAAGRFVDAPAGEDRIPLAPRAVSTGGLTARDAGPWTGGVRWRHVGSRPADEAGTVTAYGHTVWEAFASRAVRGVEVRVAIDNLLDAAWNEAQFATTSRLPGEPAPVTELHFTPGAPRSVQVGIDWRF